MLGAQVLILNSHGGIRKPDGSPIALGYHTGHWEIGLLAQAAASELKGLGSVPFAARERSVRRTLPRHNRDVRQLGLPKRRLPGHRRLVRSLPTARPDGGCDLRQEHAGNDDDLGQFPRTSSILLPGGVTLSAKKARTQAKPNPWAFVLPTARSAWMRHRKNLQHLRHRRRMSVSWDRRHFPSRRRSPRPVPSAFGPSPSGEPVWYELGIRSARALEAMRGETVHRSNPDPGRLAQRHDRSCSLRGSSNLILHLTAIAYHAGLKRPKVDDWDEVNKLVPRLVDALPNGPRNHTTAQFLAGGVPELMLKLRDLDLLVLDAMTCTGNPLGRNLEDWEGSSCRSRFREILAEQDEVNPDDAIMDLSTAKEKGLTSGLFRGETWLRKARCEKHLDRPFGRGKDGVYRMTGPARYSIRKRKPCRRSKA